MYFRFYFVILLCCVSRSFSDDLIEKLSKIEWMCANENCSEPIAIARPKQNYVPDHKFKIGLNAHQIVNIYGKPNNKEADVWLVKVGEKAGLTPLSALKEDKVLVKLSNCVKSKVDLHSFIHNGKTNVPPTNIKPSPTFEIIDGTTLPVGGSYDNDLAEADNEVTVETQESSEDSAGTTGTGAQTEPIALDNPAGAEGSSHSLKEPFISSGIKTPNLERTPINENLSDSQDVETPTKNQKPLPSPVNEYSPKESSSPPNVKLDVKQSDETSNKESSEHNPKEEISKEQPIEVEFKNTTLGADMKNVDTEMKPVESSHESVTNDSESMEKFSDTDDGKTDSNDNIERTETPSKSSGKDFSLPEQTAEDPDLSSDPLKKSGNDNVESSSNILLNRSSSKNVFNNNPTLTPPVHPTEQAPFTAVPEADTTVPRAENQEATAIPDKDGTPSESLDSNPTTNNKDKNMFGIQDQTSLPDIQYTTPLPDTQNVTSLQDTQDKPSVPNTQAYTPSPDSLNTTPLPPTEDSTSSSSLKDTTSLPNAQESAPHSTESAQESPNIEGSTPFPYSQESTLSPNNEGSTSSPETLDEESLSESSAVPTPSPADHLSSPEHFAEERKESPANIISSPEDMLAESGTDWFSPISSVIKSFKDMFSNSGIGVDDTETIHDFSSEGYNSILHSRNERPKEHEDINQSCDKDGFCNIPPVLSEDAGAFYSIPGFDGGNVSGTSLIYVTITSVIVLLFSLGYYYIENLRRDTELIAKVNSLSAELFFAQKELSTMEENISQTSENFQKLASNTTVNEEELIKLRHDLNESEAVNSGLELEIKRMEKEIEELVESNDEMHKMLTESITEEDRTQSLLASIADLKSVLSERLEEIAAVTHQLDQEKQQVELLTIALQKTEEQKENVEEKLQKVLNEIDSKALAVTKEFEEKVTSLEKIIEESSLERTNFEKEICELKAQCEKLSAEKELSEKALKKAQGIGPGKALSEWLDTKEVRVELVTSQKEVEKLRRELEEAKEHEAKLLEQKNELQSQIETLNNNYETAEKMKIETLTKLQVLSNYFKEKETQLQEELGEKEAQWLQKQSEDHTIYEQMRSLREENLSYKAQNEALKKEILDQEASFKIQIANEEQKSQENWVTLRHTERRLKEAQMEAAHLRSRLTALETNPDSLDDKHKSLEMVNGEVGLVGPGSPPFMLYAPPHDFIPPPPLVSPSRPPPLGRLSSPPLTPPPPLSPYDLYPPPPTAPSPPTHRGPPLHKPHPRDPTQQRKQKESQSSNHSSESMEKPIRRGKR